MNQTPNQPAEPRYASLRDYLRVLREHRLLIVLLGVVGCAIAALETLSEDPVYEASAAVAFQDDSHDLGIVGLSAQPVQSLTQIAATRAALITRPDVIRRAQRALGDSRAADEISSASISTLVDPSSALVSVTARSDDPGVAARIADAIARAAVRESNEKTRGRFSTAARTLRRQLAVAPNPQTEALYEAELLRLDSLSRFSRSAEIARPANVPSSPVSPNRLRSGILGLIAGLILGIIIAFLRDTLDRRLRSAHDIQAQFGLPVVGHVRDESMGRVAYLDTEGRNGEAELDLEAFRILRRNLDFLEPGTVLRSIAVTSALPEEGKTTVSGSLAFVFAVAGKRTLLVECDLRRPVLASRLRVQATPGLAEYLQGSAGPQEILRTVRFHDKPGRNGTRPEDAARDRGAEHTLVCVTAGAPTANAAELMGSDRLKHFLEKVTSAYDVVVLDTSPLLPVADTLELIPSVDGVIFCARELQTTRDQALAARAALERLPERPTGLVITGIRPHEGDYEIYAYGYGGYR